eukprot:4786977-Karenia_brevis.AAC.1
MIPARGPQTASLGKSRQTDCMCFYSKPGRHTAGHFPRMAAGWLPSVWEHRLAGWGAEAEDHQ